LLSREIDTDGYLASAETGGDALELSHTDEVVDIRGDTLELPHLDGIEETCPRRGDVEDDQFADAPEGVYAVLQLIRCK
jgi:hypothetical protein